MSYITVEHEIDLDDYLEDIKDYVKDNIDDFKDIIFKQDKQKDNNKQDTKIALYTNTTGINFINLPDKLVKLLHNCKYKTLDKPNICNILLRYNKQTKDIVEIVCTNGHVLVVLKIKDFNLEATDVRFVKEFPVAIDKRDVKVGVSGNNEIITSFYDTTVQIPSDAELGTGVTYPDYKRVIPDIPQEKLSVFQTEIVPDRIESGNKVVQINNSLFQKPYIDNITQFSEIIGYTHNNNPALFKAKCEDIDITYVVMPILN